MSWTPQRAVLLPGTGSDEVFVRSVFAGPLAELGVTLDAPRPVSGSDVVLGHLDALDAAAARGPGIGAERGSHCQMEEEGLAGH